MNGFSGRWVAGAALIAALALCGYGLFGKKHDGENRLMSSGSIWPGSKDAATLCKELAPEDPYTADAERGPAAYNACREAASSAANDAETQYHLGTSALQADHHDEAVAAFRKAEQLGSCQALYF